jgi:DedD protein
VISVPQPSAPAIPQVRETAPAVKPVAVQPATAAQPRPAASAATRPAAAAVPAQQKIHQDFWVQAGSFSSRERADGLKNTLDNKGLTAIVTNQVIDGNTFFRVRLGPYTSRNEADYWLAMVRSIDGFQDSMIWESQSRR